ncbi:MAG: EFR1 family ferrodoxin [Eubacteriales bacterium]
MTILYFTATGNSLYVAKSLGTKLCSIPQMIKNDNYEFTDDKIGIIFPLYEWSVNSFVANFLKKAKFETKYLFAIATYGIFAGGVASHLIDISKESGYTFSYINKIKMVDNYLPGFRMKTQIKNEPKKHIEEQIEKVKMDIESSRAFIVDESALRKKATKYMVKRAEKSKKDNKKVGIARNIIVEDSCTQCGICVNVCPVNNIKVDGENGKILLQNKCFSCFSCIQNCPQNAIHIKNQRDRSRFRNKNVSLKEIIQSNK